MPENASSQSGPITQAVFSVCAPPEVVSVTLSAMEAVPGAEFAGEFQEYVAGERRPQFSNAIKSAQGCVALIDCDRNPDLALETMQRLSKALPHCSGMIALSSSKDGDFLLRAMRAGCGDFLHKPLQQEDLTASLIRFQQEAAARSGPGLDLGKVISFYGVKGGAGGTTLAVHLASHLVRKHRKKVLLIDHKHELGHVALYLGIKDSAYHFGELLKNLDRLDAELLNGFVVRHHTGLDVIASPNNCSHFQENAHGIERAMEYLRSRYDFILVDSSLQYRTTHSAMMGSSDEVCMVCTPDVANIRDLARNVEHLSLINNFNSKLRVILNRANSADSISPEQVEKAVRVPVAHVIPNNYAEVTRAINVGDPIPPDARGAFSVAMSKWSSRLANGPAPPPKGEPLAVKPRFSFWR